MGIYLEPPEAARNGRCIAADSFANMDTNVLPGEVLVGLYDRPIFKLAPYIPDAAELEEFEKQYRSGNLVSHEFYAVPKWW